MLLIRCAECKEKLWKYNKIGHGKVLRCHKDRITRIFNRVEKNGKVLCPCGNEVGIDKGSFYKMIRKGFTYSGTKVNK